MAQSTSSTKTALQVVVSVICDCLCDLSPEDQARALEAAAVTLGVARSRSSTATTRGRPATDWGSPAPRLPTVQVEMLNNSPVVVNRATDAPVQRNSVVMEDPRRRSALRQLPPPTERSAPSRGYVRGRRG